MSRVASPTVPRPVSTGIGWRHPHYAELLATRPPLDFLEVHSENFFAEGGAALAVLQQARASYPVSLHGVGLALGSALGVDLWHLDQLARLVDCIEPVRVSDHACFARGTVNGKLVHAGDLLPIPFNDESLDVLCANVQQVQERLERPLMVENLSAYLTLVGSDRSETEFLTALTRRTGCQLLVDVNNIYVNALNARMPGEQAGDPVGICQAWLDQIPPDVVGEIHLAGHCVMDDIVIDDHGSRVTADVWRVYRHAINRFGAVPSLIEWDTAVPPLSVLLDEAQQARALAVPHGVQPALLR
ncbi:DUF692 domain-containing protein [Polaromonas sp.]|uniref:MNIO family bufferin maturase n=1 Tax=Polaromonas sp. TaxID=1869339 RepID=UPI003753180D